MKNIYSKPEIKVTEFMNEDIIRASGQGKNSLDYGNMNSAGKKSQELFTAVQFRF